MAVLIVALGMMAVLMSAAMPVWKQMARREKEAELVFRGQQYARAIKLFSQRAGPGVLPPSVDVLLEGKFLRKKYKDPITNDDFELIRQAQTAPSQPGQGRGGPSMPGTSSAGSGGVTSGTQIALGGIQGVTSKSKEESLRLYNGRSHYNEWQFVYVQQVQQPGAPTSGQPQRGGVPQRGGFPTRGGPAQPGGPGFPPPGNPGMPSGPGSRGPVSSPGAGRGAGLPQLPPGFRGGPPQPIP